MIPDNLDIARRLMAMAIQRDSLRQQRVSSAETAKISVTCNAFVAIDSSSDTPFPSSNRNKVEFWGVMEDATRAQAVELIERYRAAQVVHAFWHLSPNPLIAEQRRWLESLGMWRFQGTGYPTLWRTTQDVPIAQTSLDIRAVSVDEADGIQSMIFELFNDRSRESSAFFQEIGLPGFVHLLGFDGDRPVSGAMLYVQGELGYLGNASTLPSHRGRGGQSAMIRQRIELAKEAGCDAVVSETLYMLATSLGNLQRLGFKTAYDKEVFEWKDG